jgi:hypothetical protein
MGAGFNILNGNSIEVYNKSIPKGSYYRMVLLPFYAYKVFAPKQTNFQINIFQKAVLGILAAGNYHPEEIADILLIDHQLVLLILVELRNKNYLDSSFKLKLKAESILKKEFDLQNLKDGDYEIGFVYQNPTTLEFLPVFNKEQRFPENVDYKKNEFPVLTFGTKGSPLRIEPFVCRLPRKLQQPPQTPSAKEILEVVRKQGKTSEAIAPSERKSQIQIGKVKVIDELPDPVMIGAYLYASKDAISLNDWQVSDPFFDEIIPSGYFKKYVQALRKENDPLSKEIEKLFFGYKEKKAEELKEVYGFLEEEAKKQLRERFGIKLPDNHELSPLVFEVELEYQNILFRNSPKSIAPKSVIIFERLFKMMFRKYKEAYDGIWNKLTAGKTEDDRRTNGHLIEFRAVDIKAKTPLPQKLIRFNKWNLKKAVNHYETSGSLKNMIVASLMASENEPKHTLVAMTGQMNDLLHVVYDFSEERNRIAHDSKTEIKKTSGQVEKDRNQLYKIVELFIENH